MPISSLNVAPEIIVMTNYGADSDDKVGIMTTLDFQWEGCENPSNLWSTNVEHYNLDEIILCYSLDKFTHTPFGLYGFAAAVKWPRGLTVSI